MKIVSFNIRCDIQPVDDDAFRKMIAQLPEGAIEHAGSQAKLRFPKGDGINAWKFRRDRVLNKIDQERPEVIGFQELLPHQADWLRKHMPEYTFVGHGRDADYGGERPMIAVRNDLELLSYSAFWLSPTPAVPGSRFEIQSQCPRTCVVAEVYFPEQKMTARIYDTHLDHLCAEAREAGLRQLLAVIREDNETNPLPILLMGDFNAAPDDPELQPLFGEEGQTLGLKDLTADTGITFHGYGQPEDSIKIDYIFASEPFIGAHTGTSLWDDEQDGKFLSDHYPVETDFSF